MNHIYLDKIKSYESPPRIVNIFSKQEIKMIQQLYADLPERVFNKKQNVKKKAWIQSYNKELDKIRLNIWFQSNLLSTRGSQSFSNAKKFNTCCKE